MELNDLNRMIDELKERTLRAGITLTKFVVLKNSVKLILKSKDQDIDVFELQHRFWEKILTEYGFEHKSGTLYTSSKGSTYIWFIEKIKIKI